MLLPDPIVYQCSPQGDITSFPVVRVDDRGFIHVDVGDLIVPHVIGIDVFKTPEIAITHQISTTQRERARCTQKAAVLDDLISDLYRVLDFVEHRGIIAENGGTE